jgi:hypothetical protein
MKTLPKLVVCALILAVNVAVSPVKAELLTFPPATKSIKYYEGIMGTPYDVDAWGVDVTILPISEIPGGDPAPGFFVDVEYTCIYLDSDAVTLNPSPDRGYSQVGEQVVIQSIGSKSIPLLGKIGIATTSVAAL